LGGQLSIGEVSARTGVTVANLRAWESRFGFPEPSRSARGHRRYTERDCLLVVDVLHARESGVSLEAAIDRVRRRSADRLPSIFGRLRDDDRLPVTVFPKRTLLALSRAIEDECSQRARDPIVFGSFQRERFYRSSADRWRELARTAELAIVFASFARRRDPPRSPHELPLRADAPLRREWAIVCDAESFAVCISGWERLGAKGVTDGDRLFETIWSLEPRHVRSAAEVCAGLAAATAPELADRARRRFDERPPGSLDRRAASLVVNRMLAYAGAA
jgi:DICT domain-containing protein